MHRNYNLISIIVNDFCFRERISFILLIFVMLSGLLVVVTTYHTRKLIIEREQIILERDALDIEWRNLIIEENSLGNHNRIEKHAINHLGMKHISSMEEHILMIR